jgi:plasmid maintenance system antidote protein VapI
MTARCRSLLVPAGRPGLPGRAGALLGEAAHREYSRRRSRQIAYGRWQPWADAAPVRYHVSLLRRHGASYRVIAEAAGVSPMTVHHLVNGTGRPPRPVPDRIGSALAERLLAVTVPVAGTGWRDACGARRRARALVALGHCPSELARQAGVSVPRMARLVEGRTGRISPEFHAAVCRVYGRLWNQLPAERTRREQAIAGAARRRSEAAGWPPPMGLDDDRIDDPAYRTRTGWRRAAGLPGAPDAQAPGGGLCTERTGRQVIHRPGGIAGARPDVLRGSGQQVPAGAGKVMRR